MLVQHHSQRIHHVAATYPSTAEPRKYLPQSRKTSVIVPIRMLDVYLSIYRTVNNFVYVGRKDRKTPAMRLGFAREPLKYEDILWPGERVPRPKRVRRKGRVIAVPTRRRAPT